ncbi:MAG: hypothetical protein J6P88_00990 [Clostridia bacterium]|nr:hypothetical protein [Clostridia bacterium]
MSLKAATKSLLSTLFPSSRSGGAKELAKRLEGKNREMTYREWLRKNGAQEDGEALRNAGTDRAKNSPVYGAAGEKLNDRGLLGTGYADYLRERNEKTYREIMGRIRESDDERARADREGYLAYLGKWETAQDELMKKTLSHLAETKVSGIDDAYADALSAGLSDERARIVSRIAPSVARYGMRRLREGVSGVLAVSLSAGLSGEEAELLARACGVPASDAAKLRQTVESSPSRTVGSADRWE